MNKVVQFDTPTTDTRVGVCGELLTLLYSRPDQTFIKHIQPIPNSTDANHGSNNEVAVSYSDQIKPMRSPYMRTFLQDERKISAHPYERCSEQN